jgi:hypothetical protein
MIKTMISAWVIISRSPATRCVLAHHAGDSVSFDLIHEVHGKVLAGRKWMDG